MDITEMILDQHHEQRRMFATLDDLYPGDPATLSAVWERLKNLLEVHAEAEELYFYPQLLRVGTGPMGQDGPAMRRPMRSRTTTTSGTPSPGSKHSRSVQTIGGTPSAPPAPQTVTTWPRKNATTWSTSAGTRPCNYGTTSRSSSSSMNPPTSVVSKRRTRIRLRTSRNGLADRMYRGRFQLDSAEVPGRIRLPPGAANPRCRGWSGDARGKHREQPFPPGRRRV